MTERSVTHYGSSGAQGDAGRVEEAARIAADAVRVGNYDSGGLPCHFGIALHLAGVGSCHLVQDQSSCPAAQVAVPRNDSTQLGRLRPRRRADENQTRPPTVE